MAIDEEINVSSNIDAVADEGVAAVDRLQSAIDGVNGSSLDGVSSSLDDITGSDASEAMDSLASATDNVDAAGIEDASDAVGELGGASGDSAVSIMDLSAGLNVVGIAAKGAKIAAKAILEIGAAAVNATLDALALRENLRGALDQATKGGGGAALDGLSKLSRALGIDVQDASKQFIALKKEHASNANASALIKLGADIEAVGGSSEEAQAAVKRALDEIKKGGDASAAIKKVAKEFGAVGDGSNAAAKSSLTLTGALKRIQSAGTDAFADIAAGVEPQLNAVGAKLTEVFSKAGGGDMLASAIDGIGAALEYVPPIIDGLLGAWETFKTAAGPGIDLLKEAFGKLGDSLGATQGGASALSAIGGVLGAVFTVVASVISSVVSAVATMISAWDMISGAASAVIDAVTSIPDAIMAIDLGAAGTALIDGFVNGITGALGSVISAAASIGGSAKDALYSALGIASPSKIGAAAGVNLTTSVGSGGEDAIPAMSSALEGVGGAASDAIQTGLDKSTPAINAPGLGGGFSDATGARAPAAAAGSLAVTVDINVTGANATNDELARLIATRSREEFIGALRELGLIS